MKTLLIAISMIGALSLGACSNKSSNANRNVGRAGQNPAVPNSNLSPNAYGSGHVLGYSQQSVDNFVSTGIPQSQIGQVTNCTDGAGDQCQVTFSVATDPSQSTWTPLSIAPVNGNQGQYENTSGGWAVFRVYDSWTGQGGTMNPIEDDVPLLSAQLLMQNQTSGCATLIFGDDYGNVIINGVVNGQVFSGDPTNTNSGCPTGYSQGISFQNNTDINTGQPISGVLGAFQTNLCYVFQCNG